MRSRFAALLVLAAGCAAGQELTVIGSPERTLKLTPANLAKMPRTMITATEHRREVKFEGVLLRDILKEAGAPLGDRLKGKNMTAFILASGKDGYRGILTLAEVDPAFQDNEILIADTENGKPLSAEQGPFRLVIPEDKKAARWVRMLERIEVRIPEEPPK